MAALEGRAFHVESGVLTSDFKVEKNTNEIMGL
jgi:hypothetical protein